MALRSLHNTLPVTPERPKKNPKLAISSPNPAAVNDENRAPAPPAVAALESVDYVSSEDLKPFADPESRFQSLFEDLESKDWVKLCDSLNDLRRFALYHSALLLPILEKVMVVLVKAMKNPRSALCKTSIMASSDLFKSYGDKLFDFDSDSTTSAAAVDHMVLQLLLKASQDKKFVCEEAEKALKTMVGSTTPKILLHKLQGYATHGNLRVRAKAAASISHCVSKMELEGMREYGLVVLVRMGSELLKDRLPEAREAARSIVLLTYKAAVEVEEGGDKRMEQWEKFCQCNLSAIDALAMVKLVVV